MKRIQETVPLDLHIHIFGGVLGGAGAQPVQTQRIIVGVVLAAGIQLAENQLPVIPLLLLVEIHRHAPPEILHLNGIVLVMGDDDAGTVAGPGFIH